MSSQSSKVLFVATEMYPFAQTGGLGDYSHSFPKILRSLGTDIRIMIPKFSTLMQPFAALPFQKVTEFEMKFADKSSTCTIESLTYDGNMVYFLDNPYYYGRENIYGYDDELERFSFYSQAVLEALPFLDFQPDIIHCNDWHTALIPFFQKTQYSQKSGYQDFTTVLSVHTTRYQGNFDKKYSKILNLTWDECIHYGLDWEEQINCLKTGLVYSEALITDSPNFAKEILDEPLGSVITKYHKPIHGIVNGIDFEVNNPVIDQRLYAHYDRNNLEGKRVNKAQLQNALHLPVAEEVPVIALISRLFRSKGLDLVEKILPQLLRENCQFVICANGIPYYETLMTETASQNPEHMFYSHYNSDLAYKIYAGADMLLMPSFYEPCGTSQLVAMRYGTVPIVREVGGLADTVSPYDAKSNQGTGFTFKKYDPDVLLETLHKAYDVYFQKNAWNSLMSRCMSQDSSWNRSVGNYRQLYEKLNQTHRQVMEYSV